MYTILVHCMINLLSMLQRSVTKKWSYRLTESRLSLWSWSREDGLHSTRRGGHNGRSSGALCLGTGCGAHLCVGCVAQRLKRRSLAGELSPSCATWTTKPFILSRSISGEVSKFIERSYRQEPLARWISSKLQLDVCYLSRGGGIWWTLTKER